VATHRRWATLPALAAARLSAWNAHLETLGISALKVNPDPVMIATEAALWGSIKAHGFLPDTVIVSDDAGQFNVGQHAARRPLSWELVDTPEACPSRFAQDTPCKPASNLNSFFGHPTAQPLRKIGRVKAELFHSVLNFRNVHEYLP
jgi:hypothetical protein